MKAIMLFVVLLAAFLIVGTACALPVDGELAVTPVWTEHPPGVMVAMPAATVDVPAPDLSLWVMMSHSPAIQATYCAMYEKAVRPDKSGIDGSNNDWKTVCQKQSDTAAIVISEVTPLLRYPLRT